MISEKESRVKYPRLRQLRKMADMTVFEVGELLGMSGQNYAKKETGGVDITVDEAKKLSDLFDEPVETLFEIGA